MLEQLKQKNIADLLHYLLSNGSATKSDLVRSTALGNSTVSDAINDLSNLSLVSVMGKEDSIGGRCSLIYGINKDYGKFIGVAFRDDGIDFALTDCHNEVIKFWNVKYDSQISPISLLLKNLHQVSQSEKNLLGIGLGVRGEIDYKSQVVIKCEKLNWQYVHLKEIVERELLKMTIVDHCVNGAALREHLVGAAKDMDNFLYFTSLASDKVGIILEGNIIGGQHNMAGRVEKSNETISDFLYRLYKCLDVKQVIVASDTEIFGEVKENIKASVKVECNEYDLARGMAISAESKWFYRTRMRLKSSIGNS